VPLGSYLQKKFGVSVSVNNDNHLVSQALSQQHADVLGDTFAGIIFSYGVGLGLHLDGKPFAGSRSSALEFGHLGFEIDGALCRCGNRGCVEAYAANYGIARMAHKGSIDDVPIGRVSKADLQLLSAKAIAGDRTALKAFTTAGEAIGEGLATLFTLLDTMQVAMIGRTSQEFDLMREGVKTGFQRRMYRECPILELLHCFEDEKPLLDYGLAQSSLLTVDRQFASVSA
jgi:predicted NBD/HSP70 family sugar kinase